MPDWFYRTAARPFLFRMPAEASRTFALRIIGTLSRLPLGSAVIDLLGHMRPDRRLERSFLGVTFPSAVGLGPGLDGEAMALPGLARFGFGFIEIGPVRPEPSQGRPIERMPDREAIAYPDGFRSPGLRQLAPRIAEAAQLGVPIIVRAAGDDDSTPERVARSCRQVIEELSEHADLFSLDTLRLAHRDNWPMEEWREHVRDVVEASHDSLSSRPILLCVPADCDAADLPMIEAALSAGIDGVLVDGTIADGPHARLAGAPARIPALESTRMLRSRWSDLFIISAGGIHQPEHALEMLEAGANLVSIDSGLVYTGPGLAKWTNDVILFADTRTGRIPTIRREERAPAMTWFWTMLLGAGMLIGSLIALVSAATDVVLPYDEVFVGMTRGEIEKINSRLLPFMAHDRISLAGTMVAVGVLYIGLSIYGVRRGLHWAQQSVFASATVGFASFFLFLGFGYLDVFHAFVTACMLQLLLLGIRSKLGEYHPTAAPYLHETRAMRRAHWGQLVMIIHGAGLIGSGAIISTIGVTSVFVPEDLAFMNTTADTLCGVSPRLVSLVAHDRATLGGMLLSAGTGFLLAMLWGFRNGARWLWWTLAIAGFSAYAAAIGVHMVVGYEDFRHLLPAFAGLGLFLLGLGLSYRYLCVGDAGNEAGWGRFARDEGESRKERRLKSRREVVS